MGQQCNYYCYHKGALSLWCQLLFSYGSGKTTEKFLAEGRENINKISHCFLVKGALECYKSLNEGLGTHASSDKAVRWWVNAIQYGREEETDDAPRSRARHWWQMNAKWNKWNVLERTCSISCMAVATEVRISPANVYHILTNSLGNQKICGKWIPQVLNDNPIAMSVLLVTTYLPWRRNEGNAFLHHILTADVSLMHSLDPQLKWQIAEWCAQTSPRQKIAQRSQGAPKIVHVMFFSQNGLALCQPTPISTMVSGQYYYTLLQDKVRWLFTVNKQNCLSMVSFCSRTM